MKRLVITALPFGLSAILLLAAACAEEEETETTQVKETATVEEVTSPMPEPTDTREPPTLAPPTATFATADRTSGWQRYQTAELEIDLPNNWEVWDPGGEDVTDFLTRLAEIASEFTSIPENMDLEQFGRNLVLFAIDIEAEGYLTNVQIVQMPFPVDVTVEEALPIMGEIAVEDWGATDISSPSFVEVGDYSAGVLEATVPWGTLGQLRYRLYLVVIEPRLAYVFNFAARPDEREDYSLLFDDIVASFRYLGP